MKIIQYFFIFLKDLVCARNNFFYKNHLFSYKVMRKLIIYFGDKFTSYIGNFLLKKESYFPDLIQDSFANLNNITTAQADSLKKEIDKMTMIEKNYENKLVFKKDSNNKDDLIDLDYYKKNNIVRIDVKPEDLVNSKIVTNFILEPKWINEVNKVLGVDVCMTGVNAWYTFPAPIKLKNDDDIQNYQHTMLWHRDADNLRDIKLMIYLTDVFSEDDGPFQIVAGTHKNKKFNFKNYFMRDLMRVKHSIVEKMYSNNLKSFYGKKGTNFIVDTRALHRGKVIRNNKYRLILQLYFSIHPFGKIKKIPFPSPKSVTYKIWNDAIRKFPKEYKTIFS